MRRCGGGRLAHQLLVLVLLWMVSGCTPERQAFLEDSVDHATQDDILKRFGSPLSVGRLRDGREVWTFRNIDAGYSRDLGAGYCREYVLTFDDHKILKRWWRQDCLNP